jgi:hypothetical protein
MINDGIDHSALKRLNAASSEDYRRSQQLIKESQERLRKEKDSPDATVDVVCFYLGRKYITKMVVPKASLTPFNTNL